MVNRSKSLELQKNREIRKLKEEIERKNLVIRMTTDSYDPTNCSSVLSSRPLLNGTECIFAKTAKVWGNLWHDDLSLEENVKAALPMFVKMLEEKSGDGFLLALPAVTYAKNVEAFATSVRRVMSVLSEYDPHRSSFMSKSYIDRRGWQILFNDVDLFVTTFAPFYDEKSSRYQHGIVDYCYILLQPGFSFVSHGIGDDTPRRATNWTHPTSIRDKIRVGFKNHGRGYFIPESVFYPQAEHIVKSHDGMDIIDWWNAPHMRRDMRHSEDPQEEEQRLSRDEIPSIQAPDTLSEKN
jgi:hypothetical protein